MWHCQAVVFKPPDDRISTARSHISMLPLICQLEGLCACLFMALFGCTVCVTSKAGPDFRLSRSWRRIGFGGSLTTVWSFCLGLLLLSFPLCYVIIRNESYSALFSIAACFAIGDEKNLNPSAETVQFLYRNLFLRAACLAFGVCIVLFALTRTVHWDWLDAGAWLIS